MKNLKTLLNKAKWYAVFFGAGIVMAIGVFLRRREVLKRPVTSVSFDPNDIPAEPVPVSHAERVKYLRAHGLVK